MKRFIRLVVPFAGSLALAAALPAQTVPPSAPPSVPMTKREPAAEAEAARFTDLTTATPAVAAPAQVVTSLASAIRQGLMNPAAAAVPLPAAVAAASTAVVREGQAVRAEVLSQRQATLTRLRLAQSDADRQRLIENLRLQSGERMDEQRETARLVRDRLRQLRDNAMLTRPAAQ